MDVEDGLELFGLEWFRAKLLPGDTLKADREADLAEWSDEDWEVIAGRCHTGHDWCEALCAHPGFADKCDWKKLDGKDWCRLLRYQPQFAKRCDWSKLNGEEWCELLLKFPRFAVKCDWSKLNGENWSDLLRACPKFANHCDWSKLGRADRRKLFSVRPEFRKIARLRDKTQK